jgi:hypothetical protein
MNQLRLLNRWFDRQTEGTRFLLASMMLLGVACIGAFVFHSVAVYFIGIVILMALRKV